MGQFSLALLRNRKNLIVIRLKEGSTKMKEEYDFNGNGKIDPEERAIMLEDMRRKMIDADQKRIANARWRGSV
jgi:hypothetical protein